MTYPELRQKIEQQLAQLPPDQLSLVSDFLDSLNSKSAISQRRYKRLVQSYPRLDILRHWSN